MSPTSLYPVNNKNRFNTNCQNTIFSHEGQALPTLPVTAIKLAEAKPRTAWGASEAAAQNVKATCRGYRFVKLGFKKDAGFCFIFEVIYYKNTCSLSLLDQLSNDPPSFLGFWDPNNFTPKQQTLLVQ